MTDAEFAAYLGREATSRDVLHPGPVQRLAAALDRDDPEPREGDPLPPAWHWLYFLAAPRASTVTADGRGAAGDVLPPFAGLSRMWAGGSFAWKRPLRLGQTVTRTSRVASIQPKQGRMGKLVFTTVEHTIADASGTALVEEARIVFREQRPHGESAANPPEPAPARAQWRRDLVPDPVLLFRFSALTYNGHRIHYDWRYTTQTEGYPGLLVHGPLTAILLLDLVRREAPGRLLARVDYRATAPLFEGEPMAVCGAPDGPGGAKLWAENKAGRIAMLAEATFA